MPQWRRLGATADGGLVATIARADEDRRRYVSTLWDLDPNGERPPRQLTSDQATFAGSTRRGDLLYVAGGALCQRTPDGTVRVLAEPPGGVIGVVVSGSGTIVFGTTVLP